MDQNTTDSQPDADGWIIWGGGECPLEDGALHQVKFRDGHVPAVQVSASDWRWIHMGHSSDIVAYRVVEVDVASEINADGWIIWGGGECPLEAGVPHRVKFRDGSISPVDFDAPGWFWGSSMDDRAIVAYRVVEGGGS